MNKILDTHSLSIGDKVMHGGRYSDRRNAIGYVEEVTDKYVFIKWVECKHQRQLGISKYSHNFVHKNILLIERIKPMEPIPFQPQPVKLRWLILAGTTVVDSKYTEQEALQRAKELARNSTTTYLVVYSMFEVVRTDVTVNRL